MKEIENHGINLGDLVHGFPNGMIITEALDPISSRPASYALLARNCGIRQKYISTYFDTIILSNFQNHLVSY